MNRMLAVGFTALTVLLASCNEYDENLQPGPVYIYGGAHIFGNDQAALVDGAPDLARFSNPASVAVAYDETVYVTDFDNNAVRAISYVTG